MIAPMNFPRPYSVELADRERTIRLQHAALAQAVGRVGAHAASACEQAALVAERNLSVTEPMSAARVAEIRSAHAQLVQAAGLLELVLGEQPQMAVVA